jgi:hypothetical protein
MPQKINDLDFPGGVLSPFFRVSSGGKLCEFSAVKVFLLIVLLCLPMIATAQRAVPDDLIILMQRGNCEGGCPVYRILIFGNGDVIWQGRSGVARRGIVQDAIQPDAIRALIRDFELLDYFKLDDIYGYHGSSCRASLPYKPMVILSYSIAGRSRILWHHEGCLGEISEKLRALEDSIDRAVNAERWIVAKGSRKRQ